MPETLFKPSSVFSYPRGAHSAKPPEVRQALEQMYPAFGERDRIELFARGKIPGWTVWGHEAVQDDEPAGKHVSNVAPVEPKIAKAVKELFLSQAQKTVSGDVCSACGRLWSRHSYSDVHYCVTALCRVVDR
jgi:hypothetical protein